LKINKNGFAFQTARGKQSKIRDYKDDFIDCLVQVRVVMPSLFAPDLNMIEAYSLRRSLRRGSTSAAKHKGVPKEIIEMNI
jgi:hypothetical protein